MRPRASGGKGGKETEDGVASPPGSGRRASQQADASEAYYWKCSSCGQRATTPRRVAPSCPRCQQGMELRSFDRHGRVYARRGDAFIEI